MPNDDTPQQPQDWGAAIGSIGKAQGVDPELIRRVMSAESGGNPSAVSPKGAVGLMQLMPDTAKRYGIDPKDPYQNIGAGTAELKRLLTKYNGHYGRAISAYNAGEQNVDNSDTVIPNIKETQDYVVRVLGGYNPPSQAKSGTTFVGPGTSIGPAPAGASRGIMERVKEMFQRDPERVEHSKSLGRDVAVGSPEGSSLFDPSRIMTPLEREASPITAGVAKAIGTQAEPRNLAVMAAMPFVDTVNAGAVTRGLTGGFAASMVGGGVQQAGAARDEWQAGAKQRAKEDATQAAISILTAGIAGTHALKGEPGPAVQSQSGVMDNLVQQPRTPAAGTVSEVPGARTPLTEAPKQLSPVPTGPKVTRAVDTDLSKFQPTESVTPPSQPTPQLRPEVAALAKAPEPTPEMREELISRYQQILKHPKATGEDRSEALHRLDELGATDRVVPAISRPAPAQRTVDEIIKAVGPENRPKDLPRNELQQLADLSPTAATQLGLSRDDHLAAKAAWNRIVDPSTVVRVPNPTADTHSALTRVIRSKSSEELGKRQDEFINQVRQVTKAAPEVQAATADSLDVRGSQAALLAQSLQRIHDATDFAKSVTEELHANLAGKLISGEKVGFDPRTGRAIEEPEVAEEGVARPKGTPFVSAISHEERQYLNIVRGNMVGGAYGKGESPRYRLSRDPESGLANMPKVLSPEEKQARLDLANKIQSELDAHFRTVWEQGGVPTAEQRSAGTNLISLLQSTTGKRLLYSGKASLGATADPGSIAPNRAWLNWAMRRPITSHFAKPTPEQLRARITELNHEADIAGHASKAIRKSLPKDHVAHPEAPKPVQLATQPAPTVSSPATSQPEQLTPDAVASKFGLKKRPQPFPKDAPHVHEFTAPDGGSFALNASKGEMTEDFVRDKLEKRSREIKREDLSEVAKGKYRPAPLAPPKAEPDEPSKEALDLAAKRTELSQMRQHLANLELGGKGGTSTAQRIRKAIAAYEAVVGESDIDRGFITNVGTAMVRAGKRAEAENKPQEFTRAVDKDREGKSDDLIALLATASGEGVPRALHGAILKLHDLTPEDDRDYLAHTAMQAAFDQGIDVVARRYAASLNTLREGLKAGAGPQALQDAATVARTGKRPIKGKPEEAGFVVMPTFVADILNEVGKYASNAKLRAADIISGMYSWLSQGTYRDVSERSRNAMFKFRGELHRIEDLGRIAFNDGIQAIRSLPTDQQLQLMANAQQGVPLPPDLQGQRDMIQQLEDMQYVQMKKLRPNLSYWRDHIGTIWDKAPNNAAQLFERHANIVNHAILQGDRGMLRKRVYETVLDGVAHGGVPATTNLFEMSLLDLGRQAQFIHANTVLLPEIKAQGRLARGADEAARLKDMGLMPNPVRVPDNIVSTWFPVETAAGTTVVAKGSPHYMEAGELKMLQNWLAPDFVRRNVVGKALIDFKNIYTPLELFGPFHLASIVAKSMALGVSQGMNRAYNVGVIQGSTSDMIGGLQDVLTGLAMPFTAYKNGRVLREAGGQTLVAWQKYNFDKQNFLNTPNGQRLQKLVPNLEDTIDGLLEAGAHLNVNEMYATRWRQSLVQSWKDRNFIKSVSMVPFAAVEAATSPLFQKYIPAVKLFAAAREINVELKRQAVAIQNGETTKQAVMQAAVRRIDNILGEMNWENLNASRGMRSLAMLAYRAPGWRMGTIDLVKNAGYGQVDEVWEAAKARRLPTIDPNLLYLMSSLAVGAALAAIIAATIAHKAPSSMLDLTNPQTGQVDSRNKPIRLDLPLYTSRDIPEILGGYEYAATPFDKAMAPLRGLSRYATGGQTGFVSKGVEAINNRTYGGAKVSDKEGAASLLERAAHTVVPTPFGISSYQRLNNQGFPGVKGLALNALALNPSRRDLDMSPAEHILSEADRTFSRARNAKEQEKLQMRQQIQGAYLNHRFDDLRALQLKAMKSNLMTFDEVAKAMDDATKPFIERMASSGAIRPQDLLKAYGVATPNEQKLLIPYIWKAVDKDPTLAPEFKKYLQKQTTKPPASATVQPTRFSQDARDPETQPKELRQKSSEDVNRSRIVIEGIDEPAPREGRYNDRIKIDPLKPGYHAPGTKNHAVTERA